ncbi:MAG: DUF6350 family protein [Buchananella hordeovulneris]|nr:DUF6350 family protein [Buchananella hordeovulneris]
MPGSSRFSRLSAFFGGARRAQARGGEELDAALAAALRADVEARERQLAGDATPTTVLSSVATRAEADPVQDAGKQPASGQTERDKAERHPARDEAGETGEAAGEKGGKPAAAESEGPGGTSASVPTTPAPPANAPAGEEDSPQKPGRLFGWRRGNSGDASRQPTKIYPPASVSRAVLAGLEAAFLPWAVVAGLGLAVFYTQNHRPPVDGMLWTGALSQATAVWTTAFGAPLHGVQLPLPLGFTLLIGAMLYFSLRRANVHSTGPLLAGAAGFVGASSAIVVFARLAQNALPTARGAAVLAALVCAALAAKLLAAKPQEAKPGDAKPQGAKAKAPARPVPPYLRSLTAHVLQMVRAAAAMVAIVWASGALVVLISTAVRWKAVAQAGAELGLGFTGALVVTVIFLAWLPSLSLWGGAWLMGAGFQLDSTSLYSLEGYVPSTQPALPFLAAVPVVTPGWAILLLPGVVLTMVGWWLARRHSLLLRSGGTALAAQLLNGFGAVGAAIVSLRALFALSRGALGVAAEFATAGPVDTGHAASLLVGLGLGFVPAYALAHPQVWPLVRLALRGSAAEVTVIGQDMARHARNLSKATGKAARSAVTDLARARSGKDGAAESPAPHSETTGGSKATPTPTEQEET